MNNFFSYGQPKHIKRYFRLDGYKFICYAFAKIYWERKYPFSFIYAQELSQKMNWWYSKGIELDGRKKRDVKSNLESSSLGHERSTSISLQNCWWLWIFSLLNCKSSWAAQLIAIIKLKLIHLEFREAEKSSD